MIEDSERPQNGQVLVGGLDDMNKKERLAMAVEYAEEAGLGKNLDAVVATCVGCEEITLCSVFHYKEFTPGVSPGCVESTCPSCLIAHANRYMEREKNKATRKTEIPKQRRKRGERAKRSQGVKIER
jgi:hypothetical protein